MITTPVKEKAADHLRTAADMFRNNDIIPTSQALYRDGRGNSFVTITAGNRGSIYQCSLTGAVQLAGYDAGETAPMMQSPWYLAATEALRNTEPRHGNFAKRKDNLTAVSDHIVQNHGDEAAKMLSDWLRCAAESLAGEQTGAINRCEQ